MEAGVSGSPLAGRINIQGRIVSLSGEIQARIDGQGVKP